MTMRLVNGLVLALLAGCSAVTPLASPPLAGTPWQLREFAAGEGVPAQATGPAIQLRFDMNRVAGFTGCNQTSAGYTVEGTALRLAPAVSTRRACVDPAAALAEQRLHQAMAAVTRWQIAGNMLDWFDAQGKRVARFESTGSPTAASRDEVFAAERAFARSMAERDHAAFARHLDEEAIFFSGGGPVLRGKAAVAAGWRGFFDGAQAPFSWEPDQVEVLDGGTLALSTGPVRDPSGKAIARFNSIWRRTADGRWLVVFDKGSSPDPPAR